MVQNPRAGTAMNPHSTSFCRIEMFNAPSLRHCRKSPDRRFDPRMPHVVPPQQDSARKRDLLRTLPREDGNAQPVWAGGSRLPRP